MVRLLPYALLCLILIQFSACSKKTGSGINPGDRAPNIVGISLDGSKSSIDDQKGKIILVNFWASWCAPCVSELPALEKLYSQLKEDGLNIIGVALDDTVENVKEYQEKYKLSFPLIIDSNSDSKRSYQIKGLPESFILNSQHQIMMLQDIGSNELVTRIIGPREWSSEEAVLRIKELLAK